jgi:DNA-binding winged helix-turn-helix (wHTH) protein
VREDNRYFEFCGLHFLPNTGVVKIPQSGAEISLTETQRRFLVVLLENAGEVVSYENLREQVWPHETKLDRRLQHTIHVTKRGLLTELERYGVKADFIEAAPGNGYRLATEVKIKWLGMAEDTGNANVMPAEVIQSGSRFLNGHLTFAEITSALYGFLFWIALILEVAYEFQRYGAFALRVGFLIWILNSCALLAALALAYKRLRERKGDGLFAGLSILTLGVIVACGLASWCLPNVPITSSTLQAQPALAAFMKNALVYFAPLAVFYLLCPFYFVVAAELKTEALIATVPMDVIFVRPRILLMISLAAILYSLISSFYMLDHLLPGTYHGFFVSLIFMRFLIYFGLAVGSTLWYRASLTGPNSAIG